MLRKRALPQEGLCLTPIKPLIWSNFRDSAIEVVHGKVQRLNRVAMHCFPGAEDRVELPGFLLHAPGGPDGAGAFTHQGILYLFSRVAGAEGSLLLVRPAPKPA